jgi:hypothetical protein
LSEKISAQTQDHYFLAGLRASAVHRRRCNRRPRHSVKEKNGKIYSILGVQEALRSFSTLVEGMYSLGFLLRRKRPLRRSATPRSYQGAISNNKLPIPCGLDSGVGQFIGNQLEFIFPAERHPYQIWRCVEPLYCIRWIYGMRLSSLFGNCYTNIRTLDCGFLTAADA